jgi:hypothetical protein
VCHPPLDNTRRKCGDYKGTLYDFLIMVMAAPACLKVQSWRVATSNELRVYLESVMANARSPQPRKGPSVLAVRRSLSPVDVYCYLKARFGEPNGVQTFLRNKDDSNNWIHWDFNLKAGTEDVCICGTSREIHFMISSEMSDDNWRELIITLKRDFARVAEQKSAVLKSFEKWVVFPNKFVDLAGICADLHAEIRNNTGAFRLYRTPSAGPEAHRQGEETKRLLTRLSKCHRASLELALLTPILAEAFINMMVLILCKPEIRDNVRQFSDFIRSQIDVKLFDLPYKCKGFARPINQQGEGFKKFKRVMDQRNRRIHGNCDPEAEQLEIVYFEGTRPLFVEPGDHIAKFLEVRERQYQPESVVGDYEATYNFLMEITNCLEPAVADEFNRFIETHYPGYDVNRKKMGVLFPDYVAVGQLEGLGYDDDLYPSA